VLVDTCLEQAHPKMVKFAYKMRTRAAKRLLATGYTKHVFCNRELKPTRLPEKYWPHFGIRK